MAQDLLSTSETAKMLGVSRVAVFKKIKTGEINARKIGRNYVISRKDLGEALGAILTAQKKRAIEQSVQKTIREYGETLKLLGKE